MITIVNDPAREAAKDLIRKYEIEYDPSKYHNPGTYDIVAFWDKMFIRLFVLYVCSYSEP